MTRGEQIFNNLAKIGIVDKETGELTFEEYVKLKSGGFMDLNIDELSNKPPFVKIAMAHNGMQNGDVMADPDMEILIDIENKSVQPLTFQNDYVGVYQQVFFQNGDGKLVKDTALEADLTSFLLNWTKNLIDQGFKYEGVSDD